MGLWLALTRWRAPLRTLGAAPELCGDDGDGGGARTRTGAGDGAVDGAGALAEDGAGGRRALTGTALAPEQAARDSHTRTHARTHTPHPHTQLLLLAPLVQLAA
jgi:hypothetical protein